MLHSYFSVLTPLFSFLWQPFKSHSSNKAAVATIAFNYGVVYFALKPLQNFNVEVPHFLAFIITF